VFVFFASIDLLVLQSVPFVRSSGEFERCPDWVPTVDKRRRCDRIDLKTMDVCGFDQRVT